MISPVSTTGRTMMASLQQAMSKGMPVDQAIAHVKSMAMDGVAPLADLYSMLTQFQRLKEQAKPMPQPATIRDQLNQAETTMSAGLGGLDAGSMENPSFAGGGIVAFQTGGVPDSKDPNSGLPYLQNIFEGYGEQLGAGRVPYMQGRIQEQEEIDKQLGLGKYGELRKAQEREAALMESELPGKEREARRQDMAEFFFNIAAEASKPGSTLLSSISRAGPGYAKQDRETKNRLSQLRKEARMARMKLLEADELRTAGRVQEASNLYQQTQAQMVAIGAEIAKTAERKTEAAEEREFRTREAEKERGFRREQASQESADRMALEERRGEIEMEVREGTASPEDKAGLAYLELARTKGDNHPDTQKALQRWRNLQKAGLSSLPIGVPPPGGAAPASPNTGVVDFSSLK